MKCLTLVLLLSGLANAATYYIDATGGLNTNSGTAPNQAWQTFAVVNVASLSAGDTVLLKRGEVFLGQLVINGSGSAGNPIRVDAYGSGAQPIIEGTLPPSGGWTATGSNSTYWAGWLYGAANAAFQDATPLARAASSTLTVAGSFYVDTGANRIYIRTTDNTDPTGKTIKASVYPSLYQGLIQVVNRSYIEVRNIKLNRSNYYGIYASGGSNHTYEYNTISQSYHNGMQTVGNFDQNDITQVRIAHNTLIDTGMGRNGPVSSNESECVGINGQGWTTGGYIGYNTVTNAGGEGIQIHGGSSNVVIEGNVITNSANIGLYLGSGWGNAYRNGGTAANNILRYNTVRSGPNSVSPAGSISGEEVRLPVSGINTTTDVLTTTVTHYQAAGTPIYIFAYTTLPTSTPQVVSGTTYYVCAPSGATLKLGTAADCVTPIDMTSAGSNVFLALGFALTNNIVAYNVFDSSAAKAPNNYGTFLFGSGGAIYGGTGPPAPLSGNKIYHNVFYGDSFVALKAFGPTSGANYFYNNIYQTSGGHLIWVAPSSAGTNSLNNYAFDYDVLYNSANVNNVVCWESGAVNDCSGTYWSLANWRTNVSLGNGSVASNPLFSGTDFRLQSGSPAKDIGTVINGIYQQRYGAAPDAGAYEYSPPVPASSVHNGGQVTGGKR